MIKYEIIRYSSDGYGGSLSKTKLVKKSELQKHLDNDWFLRKKIIPIITPLKDWWKPISFTNKVAIFGIILTAFLTLFLWSLSEYFQYKKSNLKTEKSLLINRFDSLKKSNDSLNLNFELLNQRFHSLTDSLNQKNKIIENLKLEIKSKNTSGKK